MTFSARRTRHRWRCGWTTARWCSPRTARCSPPRPPGSRCSSTRRYEAGVGVGAETAPTVAFWNGANLADNANGKVMVGLESEQGTTARAFFRMNTSSMNTKHILGATFRIKEKWSWSCQARPVQLWRVGPISSSTTWNNQPSWDVPQQEVNTAHGNENFGCGDADVEFNATAAVREAEANNWPDLTLGLRAANEGDAFGWKRFDEKPDAGDHLQLGPEHYRPAFHRQQGMRAGREPPVRGDGGAGLPSGRRAPRRPRWAWCSYCPWWTFRRCSPHRPTRSTGSPRRPSRWWRAVPPHRCPTRAVGRSGVAGARRGRGDRVGCRRRRGHRRCRRLRGGAAGRVTGPGAGVTRRGAGRRWAGSTTGGAVAAARRGPRPPGRMAVFGSRAAAGQPLRRVGGGRAGAIERGLPGLPQRLRCRLGAPAAVRVAAGVLAAVDGIEVAEISGGG